MSVKVRKSTSDSDMVRPLVTRKSRQFQTARERWTTLRQTSSRSFDRLNLRNRFEEERLIQRHQDISNLSDAQLKDIFRVKNEMRVALIDIAKSKREAGNHESDFESRLRSGSQSPIFQMEYRRLKRKKVELEKLSEQLKGPNSTLLATNLTSELKIVDAKALKEATRGESKYKGRWLAPLKALAKAQGDAVAAAGGATGGGGGGGGGGAGGEAMNKLPGNDFANLVKLVHKQFKKASISNGEDSGQILTGKKDEVTSRDELTIIKEDSKEKISQSTTALPAIRGTDSLVKIREPAKTHVPEDKSISDHPTPSTRSAKPLIPIASAISLLESPSTAEQGTGEVRQRKRRQRKPTELSLPTVLESSESLQPKAPAFLAPPIAPKPKSRKSKRQKARAAFLKGTQKKANADAHVSRTESARHRDRLMKRRLSDLAAKTKEDIAHRRSISPHDEALSSIHQAEVVARLQLARSKVGIKLPELRKDKNAYSQGEMRRSSKGKSETVNLPPINIEGKLLRELQEQRRKHRYQSTGLPKLPK